MTESATEAEVLAAERAAHAGVNLETGAIIAYAEAPDPAPEPDPEPEPEPEPAAPATDMAAEAALKQLDRLGDGYTRKVLKLLEATPLGLVECPLCPIPGFVPEVPDTDVDPFRRLAVLAAIGETAAPTFQPAEHLHRCATCDGWGALATGSRRATDADVQCEPCAGRGYIDERHAHELALIQTPAAALTLLPDLNGSTGTGVPIAPSHIAQGGHTFVPIAGGAPDQVGRLAGHPLWGMPREAGGL